MANWRCRWSPSSPQTKLVDCPPPSPYLLKLQTRRFSIHGVSPLLECPPAPVSSAKNSDFVADFLVNSLGFSRAEAVAISAKVSPFKSKQRPVSVAHFFEQIGFDETQIRIVVSSVPKILGSSVEKNLRPKIAVFQEIGVSGSDLVKFISNNPQIIESSLHATILPTLELMRSVFASDEENMVRAIKKGVWMLNSATYARRNIELLRSYGVSDQRIQRFLLRFPKTLYGKPEWLEDVVVRVEEELGIPRQSAMFMYGVDALAAMSKKTLESKYEIFKSYGWSQSDVLTLGRKLPSCLRLSDAKIRTRLDYFMKELGFDPAYLASHPVLLKLSLENRILPRNAVLRVLKENKVMEANLSFWTVMALTDAEFLRRFVMEYKDLFPHLCDVYFNDKVDSPLKALE